MAEGAARRDVDAVVAAWAQAGARLDEASRRAVVAAVVHALEGGRSASWIEALYRFDPTLSITVDDARSLRVVLHDHLVAPRDPAEALALQHRLGLLIDELIAAAAERRLQLLEQTAMVDPLTGLLNRRGFDAAFASTLAQARRHGRTVALAMVDLVGLKRINDTSGHAAGDETLRAFAGATSRGLRAGDNAFRIGGDEFVVLAPDTTSQDLALVMRRIAEEAPAFSVGIAEMPTDGEDAAMILSVADARLYGTRRIEAESRRPRLLNRASVALMALALAGVAAILAELVRRAVGVDATGTTAATWQLILVTAPVACSVAAAYRGRATLVDAFRRGSSLAAISLLAMIATMTPLFVRTAGPDGTRQWLAGGPLDPDTPESTPRPTPPTTTRTSTTTTTTTTTVVGDDTTADADPAPTDARADALGPRLLASPTAFGVTPHAARPSVTPTTAPGTPSLHGVVVTPVVTPVVAPLAPVVPIVPGSPTVHGAPIVPGAPVAAGAPPAAPHGVATGHDTTNPNDGRDDECTANPNASDHVNNGRGRDGQEVRCEPTPRRRQPIPGPTELVPGQSHGHNA